MRLIVFTMLLAATWNALERGIVLAEESLTERIETSAEKKADLPLVAQMKKKLKSMNLTPEVFSQATKIVDEYGPLYVAAQKKRQVVLTEEQRAIQAATAKSNKEAGKQGRDVLDGMQDALKLTPEQKSQWDAAEKEKNAVGAKLYDSLRAVLTPEQQDQFGVPKKGNSAYEK
jgi:hypothetical protein